MKAIVGIGILHLINVNTYYVDLNAMLPRFMAALQQQYNNINNNNGVLVPRLGEVINYP